MSIYWGVYIKSMNKIKIKMYGIKDEFSFDIIGFTFASKVFYFYTANNSWKSFYCKLTRNIDDKVKIPKYTLACLLLIYRAFFIGFNITYLLYCYILPTRFISFPYKSLIQDWLCIISCHSDSGLEEWAGQGCEDILCTYP